jgi:HEAT repeat protein
VISISIPRRALLLLVVILVPAAIPARNPESVAEPSEDEKALRDAGIATDPLSLIRFFRSRTPTQADQARLSNRIVELGSIQFRERERASQELTEAGRVALPLLRAALSSEDLEVSRRASRCLEQIENSPVAELVSSAARLLATCRPDGSAQALISILPWIDDETAEEAVLQALLAVGLKNKEADPAIVAAATDREASKRAAAGFVLGQATPDQRNTATKLLTDGNARVRFRAAVGLLHGGDRAAVPVLIALLENAPGPLVWQAEDILDRLAGEADQPGGAGNDAASRHRTRLAWEVWWKANAARVDIGRATRDEVYLGLNLVVELDSVGRGGKGRVWECGMDGRSRWEITDLERPIDARLLPGGHVLIAEHGPARVTERLRNGAIVWEYTPLGQPVSCQRLTNGNTFIATYNELIEVNRDKVVVCSIKVPANMVFYASKLRNGHYLYVSNNNRVVEVDASGREVHSVSVENTSGWASVELLSNGNLLVAQYYPKKVVEVDRVGKVTWQCGIESPGHASRLRNGNTLVTSIEGRRVVEFDRAGKEVWRQATTGRPFHAYRR